MNVLSNLSSQSIGGDSDIPQATIETISDRLCSTELPPPTYLSRPSSRKIQAHQTSGDALRDRPLNDSVTTTASGLVITKPIEDITTSESERALDEMRLVSFHVSETVSSACDSNPDDICVDEVFREAGEPEPFHHLRTRRTLSQCAIVDGVLQNHQSRPQTSATVFLESYSCSSYDDSSFESITSSEDSGDWSMDLRECYERQQSSQSDKLAMRDYKDRFQGTTITRRFSDGTNPRIIVTDLET